MSSFLSLLPCWSSLSSQVVWHGAHSTIVFCSRNGPLERACESDLKSVHPLIHDLAMAMIKWGKHLPPCICHILAKHAALYGYCHWMILPRLAISFLCNIYSVTPLMWRFFPLSCELELISYLLKFILENVLFFKFLFHTLTLPKVIRDSNRCMVS